MLSTNFRSCLVLTSGQKPKKMVRAVFEKKYQSIWFWANLETFSRISPYQEFFSKNWLCHFSTFMQKIRKILWTVSEKTAVPTNQPINQPTNQPTKQPTNQPTNQPNNQPTNQPIITKNTDLVGPCQFKILLNNFFIHLVSFSFLLLLTFL